MEIKKTSAQELKETIPEMLSEDYKERLRYNYLSPCGARTTRPIVDRGREFAIAFFASFCFILVCANLTARSLRQFFDPVCEVGTMPGIL